MGKVTIVITNIDTLEMNNVCENVKFGDAINIVSLLNNQLPKETNLLYSIKNN